ncbi:hypothetical protein TgHK011_002692 [Trichoderma gracile]|nr:hypothetical protein TgHK011_002692 [Trichoderma gracile]
MSGAGMEWRVPRRDAEMRLRRASPMSHGAQEPGAAEMRRCVAHILRRILGTNHEPTIQSLCIQRLPTICQKPSPRPTSKEINAG